MVNLSIFIVLLAFSTVFAELKVKYEWKYIDYEWKSPEHKQHAINSGNYTPVKIFTIDVDKDRAGRVFITTPRDQGVPATLSTVTDKVGDGGPLLRPYPNWAWNSATDCTGITSVYRVAIDRCNRMFVLDTGKSGDNQVCPAQLLIFDLSHDRLIKRVTIPSKYATSATSGKSLLITPVVQTEGPNCAHTRVYMADVDGWGLVVWDGTNLRRFSSSTFNADPEHENFKINGDSFQLADGIFSLALKPKRSGWDSGAQLFYRPLASVNQYSVDTDQLVGQPRRGCTGEPDYHTFDYKFPTQVSIQAFSRDGVLFFGYVGTNAIGCWNSNKPMNDENVVVVAQNQKTLQFLSGLKIISRNVERHEELWACINPFQKIALGTINLNEVNYRVVHARDIRNLTKGTKCQTW